MDGSQSDAFNPPYRPDPSPICIYNYVHTNLFPIHLHHYLCTQKISPLSVGQLVISQYSHNFEQQEAISYFYFYCNKMGLHNNSDTKCKCDTLGDLVPFLQFQKSKNQAWRSVNSTKCDTPPWVFYMFFSLYKHHQIYHRAQ